MCVWAKFSMMGCGGGAAHIITKCSNLFRKSCIFFTIEFLLDYPEEISISFRSVLLLIRQKSTGSSKLRTK
jgi:hypothetical protein